jgi:hypothetical protein
MRHGKLVVALGLMAFLFSAGAQAHRGHHQPPKECQADVAEGGACAGTKGKAMWTCLKTKGSPPCQTALSKHQGGEKPPSEPNGGAAPQGQ